MKKKKDNLNGKLTRREFFKRPLNKTDYIGLQIISLALFLQGAAFALQEGGVIITVLSWIFAIFLAKDADFLGAILTILLGIGGCIISVFLGLFIVILGILALFNARAVTKRYNEYLEKNSDEEDFLNSIDNIDKKSKTIYWIEIVIAIIVLFLLICSVVVYLIGNAKKTPSNAALDYTNGERVSVSTEESKTEDEVVENIDSEIEDTSWMDNFSQKCFRVDNNGVLICGNYFQFAKEDIEEFVQSELTFVETNPINDEMATYTYSYEDGNYKFMFEFVSGTRTLISVWVECDYELDDERLKTFVETMGDYTAIDDGYVWYLYSDRAERFFPAPFLFKVINTEDGFVQKYESSAFCLQENKNNVATTDAKAAMKLYASFLESDLDSFIKKGIHGSVIYFDEDDIPELLLSRQEEKDGSTEFALYTISNDHVAFVDGISGENYVKYLPQGNLTCHILENSLGKLYFLTSILNGIYISEGIGCDYATDEEEESYYLRAYDESLMPMDKAGYDEYEGIINSFEFAICEFDNMDVVDNAFVEALLEDTVN